MPSSHLILCRPLLLLPPVPPSIRVFSSESTLRMRWPKYWSFSFSIIPSKEYPGLISFRMDWLDLLAVQGTLKSLHQHHSSKASILRRSAFFTVQHSYPYILLYYKSTAGIKITFLLFFYFSNCLLNNSHLYFLVLMQLTYFQDPKELSCFVFFFQAPAVSLGKRVIMLTLVIQC